MFAEVSESVVGKRGVRRRKARAHSAIITSLTTQKGRRSRKLHGYSETYQLSQQTEDPETSAQRRLRKVVERDLEPFKLNAST